MSHVCPPLVVMQMEELGYEDTEALYLMDGLITLLVVMQMEGLGYEDTEVLYLMNGLIMLLAL